MALTLWLVVPTLAGAQERFVRAEESPNHELVITTSAGRSIVVPKSEGKLAGGDQQGFESITISPDGSAVGWAAGFDNCCTSYSIPVLVEVYKGGQRHTFDPTMAPWDWCFVDGSTRIAARSTTVHGPQDAVFQLWDLATDQEVESFYWGQNEKPRRAPAWVEALEKESHRLPSAKTHFCSTKR